MACLLNADDVLHEVLSNGMPFITADRASTDLAGPWWTSDEADRPLGANVNGVYGGEVGDETSMYWKYSQEEGDPTLTGVVIKIRPDLSDFC